MSLIFSSICVDGIVCASDIFMYDNDGIWPQKAHVFEKLYVSEKHHIAAASVGSRWVFNEFQEYLNSAPAFIESDLAEKWQLFNSQWKNARTKEIEEGQGKTLRDISDSVLILNKCDDLSNIYIICPDGSVNITSTFAYSGSGSFWAEKYLEKNENLLSNKITSFECIKHLLKIYDYASSDLFVCGIPAIAVLKKDRIIDLTSFCKAEWTRASEIFKKGFMKKIEDKIL